MIAKEFPYTLEKIVDLAFYTEGPAIDSTGNIFFTTLSGEKIIKTDLIGNTTCWSESACPNGQIILPDGSHVICDSKLASVRRFNKNGEFVKNEVIEKCAGQCVRVPNDLCCDSSGGIYFTDSVRTNGSVFFLGADGEQSVVATGLDYPNGIVIEPGENALYVSESYKNRILKIFLKAPGVAEDIVVFTELPQHKSGDCQLNLPDGLALQVNGNLWVAHYGMGQIQVVSPKGEVRYSIGMNMPLISNICFINAHTVVVTGGFSEPGPGAVMKLNLLENLTANDSAI